MILQRGRTVLTLVFFFLPFLFPQQVLATASKETKLIFSIQPSLVALNDELTANVTLKDDHDVPLANKKIVFTYDAAWNYGEYKLTDAKGQASFTLPIKSSPERTGFCGTKGSQHVDSRYQAEAYFQGDSEYKGVMGRIDFLVSSERPSNASRSEQTFLSSSQSGGKKPEPVIYWMWDYCNLDPNKLNPDKPPGVPGELDCNQNVIPNGVPLYGPFGSLFYQHWDRLGDIGAYLDKASAMKITLPDGRQISKPVIFGVYFF
ncbi:MAG: hypothetical protein ACPLY7_00920, partial [Microgenomates group bacterium]